MTAPRSPRFVWLDDVRVGVHDGVLGHHAGYVALVLGVHYINGGRSAWPSQFELGQATGLGERTVRRALHELEQNGFIEIRHGGKQGNIYRLPNRPHRPVSGH